MESSAGEAAGDLPLAVGQDDARRLLDLVAAGVASERLPIATYRLQLNHEFDFRAAAQVAAYLAALGITDLYSSPILRAAPGSMHGYDVVDHTQLNPELGTPADFDALVRTLRDLSLGLVLDIVPNHMSVGRFNPLWWDLLENGPSAKGARFFDIEFHPVKEELVDKVLLPLLGDRFGAVLERGELKLLFENGAFQIGYFDQRFPVNPRTYPQILKHGLPELEARVRGATQGEAEDGALRDLDDLKSILTSLEHLPQRHERDPLRQEERRREKEVVKRRLAQLCEASALARGFVEENVRLFNGEPGSPRSFDLLDRLLTAQAYRLAWWRVSSEEINYRRFFDINTLAAIRVEDPVVFDEVHRLPLQLVAEGKVTGLRVDHPDGLALPSRYFRLLQEARVLQLARVQFESERGAFPGSWDELVPALREELAREVDAEGAASPLFRPLYVVAEKILGRTEQLPAAWAVSGTTGYDFLNALNGLFVERESEEKLTRIYHRFLGRAVNFEELVYAKKKLILYTALAAEMNLLARQLNRISEHNRWTRDFTLYALRAALIEIVASFPVYRTYVDANGFVSDRDRRYIELAVAKAKRRNPVENAAIYDFIKRILLQRFEAHVAEEERPLQLSFALKLQQMLGPVMAKGLEDTVFYLYNRLISLNEVGGEPRMFGTTLESFHTQNEMRARDFPRSLLASATHDTKRGEDARARIDVLSELPAEWRSALSSFSRRTEPLRRTVELEGEGQRAPDQNELMIFWQTLLGVFPLPPPGTDPHALPPPDEMASLRERVQAYLFKAIKEAKVNTSWIEDNPAWEQAVNGFVGDVLSLPPRHLLWKAFLPFARRVAQAGMYNSLSQLVVKMTAPGVPDVYQGTELWDLSLVDPDNRRPVDFQLRARLLAELQQRLAQPRPEARVELVRELLASWEDGRIKLLVTHLLLTLRREQAALFGGGGYLALTPRGPRENKLIAFARTHESGLCVTIVPRLVTGLLGGDAKSTQLDSSRFAGTLIPLPPGLRPGDVLRDALTGETRTVRATEQGPALAADELFGTLPVAVLVS